MRKRENERERERERVCVVIYIVCLIFIECSKDPYTKKWRRKRRKKKGDLAMVEIV